MMPAAQQRWRQLAPRLMEKEIWLQADTPKSKTNNISLSNPGQTQIAAKSNIIMVDPIILDQWKRADLVEASGCNGWKVSATGRAKLRREQHADTGFQDQHQIREAKTLTNGTQVRRNCSDTALDWLVHRKGGKFQLTECELTAAKYFQSDYGQSNMQSRVTMDWRETIATRGLRRAAAHEGLPISALDARKRLGKAIDFVGPGLGDLLITICCQQSGLEESEAMFGWPKRSSKLVLKMGLAQLSVFYGLQSAKAASASLRMR
jgi:hypothetical protein